MYECTGLRGDSILPAMNNSLSLLVLEPPYAMVRWLRDDAPAMGSVLLIDTVIRDTSIPDLRSTMDIAPWCPICVLSLWVMNAHRLLRFPYGRNWGTNGTMRDGTNG